MEYERRERSPYENLNHSSISIITSTPSSHHPACLCLDQMSLSSSASSTIRIRKWKLLSANDSIAHRHKGGRGNCSNGNTKTIDPIGWNSFSLSPPKGKKDGCCCCCTRPVTFPFNSWWWWLLFYFLPWSTLGKPFDSFRDNKEAYI